MRARLPTWHAKITLLVRKDTRGLWLKMTSPWLAPRVAERMGRLYWERGRTNIPVLHSRSPLPFFESRETYVGLIRPTKRTFTRVLHKRQVTKVLPFLLRSYPVSPSFSFTHVRFLTKKERWSMRSKRLSKFLQKKKKNWCTCMLILFFSYYFIIEMLYLLLIRCYNILTQNVGKSKSTRNFFNS